MPKLQPETIFFYFILAVLLIPIIVCDFIVTGDGPCHIYNSKILLSSLFENKANFYMPFVQFNPYPDPNWITNAIQLPLLLIFSPAWSEKIFFILYLIAFVFGFRKVVMEINPRAEFISCIGSLFAWNYLLMKGFSNNAWSIAIWFWVIGFWLVDIRKKQRTWAGIGMGVLFLLLYFSHPIGYVFGLLSVACIIISTGWFVEKGKGINRLLRNYWREGSRFFMITLLPNALLVFFYLRRDWAEEPVRIKAKTIANDLWHMVPLINLTEKEEDWVLVITLLIIVLVIITIGQKWKHKNFTRFDGLMLLFLISMIILFFPPSGFSGGLVMGIRLRMIPFLCLLFWMATNDFHKNVRYGASAVALLVAIVLTFVRLPIQISASRYAKEVISCKDLIADQSTVLVLNYDWNGQPVNKDVMPDKNWLFPHIDCYLGLYKDLIISDNYELHFGYFPLVERWETNMYKQTDKDGINFDHRPPRADILNYKKRTGYEIDYVLLLSYTHEHAQHPYTIEIFDQLTEAYQKTFTSENQRAILYKRIAE